MKNVLKYKDFIGTVEYSADDEAFFGKLAGVDDLVTFEARSVEELKEAFQEAVNDYIELCQEAGKNPHKSFKGSFNIRIKPELHKKAAKKSTELGISLNQFVERAIDNLLKVKDIPVSH